MGLEDFAVLRNLAFYDGFNTRYVYFKSLQEYNATRGASTAYDAKRLEVRQSIENGVNSFYERAKKQKDSIFLNHISKFIQCSNFLLKAAEYESANEMAFFEQKLNEIKSTFSDDEKKIPEVKALIDMFENSKHIDPDSKKEAINYKYFLTLVNSLLQGIDRTKTVANYEKERIGQISDALDSMRKNREKQLLGLATKQQMNPEEAKEFIDKNMSHYNEEIKTYYIKNKNYASKKDQKGKVYEHLTGATTAFRKIPKEVSVELSNWINKQLDTILSSPEVLNAIIAYVKENAIVVKNYQDQIASTVKGIIAQALVKQALTHLNEIIHNKYRNIPKQKIIKELENSIDITQSYKIEGFYQNFGMTGKHLKGFENLNKTFDLHEASSREFMEMFSRLRRSVDSSKRNKYKLSKARQDLYDYMEENEIYDEYEDISRLIAKLESIENTMQKYEAQIKRGLIKNSLDVPIKNLGKNTQKQSVQLSIHVTPKGVSIDNFEQGVKSLAVFQRVFGEDSNMSLSSVKNAISTITRNASIQLRNKLADSVDKAIESVANDEKDNYKEKLNEMIRDGLQNLTISVKGPDLAELISAIDFEVKDKSHVSVNWSGKSKIKNDTISISIDNTNFHFSTSFETLIERKTQDLSELIAQGVSNNELEEQLSINVISAFQNATAKGFARNTMAQSKRYSANAKIFLDSYYRFQEGLKNVANEYKKVTKDWEEYEKKLKGKGVDEKTIREKYKKIVNSLKDSFYISNTVKAYNHYNNDIGFSGGSIGGTLDAQLKNISDVFELAGMPISDNDRDWLHYLIINCAPTTLRNRDDAPMLEQYLGSMAAFMLFDEGGAEARILNDLSTDISLKQGSHPKILHLYSVNGIYVTGSYVLYKTYQELQKCLTAVSSIKSSEYQGAGVRIINPMNEGMIPNRGGQLTNIDEDPWGTVGNIADKSVSIEIFFLAGLLDIMNSISETLGNIELPS